MKDLYMVITLAFSLIFFSSRNPSTNETYCYYTKDQVDSLLRERDKKIDSLINLLNKNKLNFAVKKIPILEKLTKWQGPQYKVTSLLRNNPSSQHYRGEAIDLAYSDSLVLYLLSDEGKQFLQENNLSFYIENNRKCSNWRYWQENEEARKYLKIIPWATGLHIHLYIERDVKQKNNRIRKRTKDVPTT